MKICAKCGLSLSEDAFSKHNTNNDHKQYWCRSCVAAYRISYMQRPGMRERKNQRANERSWRMGTRVPVNESRGSASFLGLLSEKVLSHMFDGVRRMPTNNPGYDFVCARGLKIDVKSSTRHAQINQPNEHWTFSIRYNKVADYFLCLAFDNRESLNPEHVWLIPARKINMQSALCISETVISKWSEYERSLDKVNVCCGAMRDLKVL